MRLLLCSKWFKSLPAGRPGLIINHFNPVSTQFKLNYYMTTPLLILSSVALLMIGFLLGWYIRTRQSVAHDDFVEIKRELEESEHIMDLESYRKEFMGNVYHELKTPIFNMQGYILTLLDGGLEDESINIVYLKRAEKNINRMISIVEDLESISGLESGALNLKIENFDISKLIDDIVEATEMRASGQNIRLDKKKIKEADAMVSGDKSGFTRYSIILLSIL